MKVVALVLSTFVLALLCREVHCQVGCGSWSLSSYTVGEGDSFVTLTAQSSSGEALQFATRADSATAGPPGGDYNGGSGILTFSTTTQQQVFIVIVDDDESESTESFFVDLTLLDGTLCDTATVEILDDEPTPPPPTTPPPNQMIQWQEIKYYISEGGGSLEICAAPVGSLSSPVTITDIVIEDKTATFAVDYFPLVPDSWTFTDSTPQCITLFIVNDNIFEGPVPETICASFFQEGFGIQETTICILDDEPVIAIEWEQDLYEFDEGGNTTYMICAVANDTIIGDRIEERYVVFRNYSAIAGEDYVDPGVLVLRFEAGDTRMCIQIEILDDDLLESEECFHVDLVSHIEGIETSTTKVQINDDEGQITLNVEREIYTVVEGNYLEVCVVIAGGGVAAFPFHVTGHVFFFGYPVVYFFIYFSVGDTRSCASAFFPGNDYLDKLEREKEIFFVVEESEFSEFVEFDRNSAWCFLADDDIVSIGFAEPTYTALEDGGSVKVCLELCEGSINRPIDVLLYTDDGSALDEVNYEGGVRIVTLLAYGAPGDLACTYINILDDGVPTSILYFSLNIYISDTHVLIPDDKANATVFIQPAFEICFDMFSPRVNGSELFLSFESTVPVDAAVCMVDSLADQDCTNGSALFIFTDAARTEMYDIRIEATFGSETRILENSVRSELTDVCDVHLVNKGLIFNGNNATIYLQPTGPDPDARILDLECRCREGETVFTPCPAGSLGPYDTVHFDYVFPDGCTRLSVRPINDGRCSPRRAIQIIPPSASA